MKDGGISAPCVHDSLRWLQRYLLAANIFNANALLSALLATMYLYKPPSIPPRGGGGCRGFCEHCLGARSRGEMCLLVNCVQLGCPAKQYELVTSMLGKYVYNVIQI